jgi:hypothetical protein
VQAVHDALAFVTAAVAGDVGQVTAIAEDALATDRDGFVDALATTVAVVADEAELAGADIPTALRDVALGIHLAGLAERPPRPDEPPPTDG